MYLLIKINDNKRYGRTQQRLGCSDVEAGEVYVQKLLRKRLVPNLAEARRKLADESGLWKDGYVVEARGVSRGWGRLEPYAFLFIRLAASYAPEKILPIIAPKYEQHFAWEERPRFLARAKYRFPYWDYLTNKETALVRDPLSKSQPLLNEVFYIDDLELV